MTSLLDLDSSHLAGLDKNELLVIIATLQEQVRTLEQQITEQAVMIQSLQDQLAKNSRNSGKPPGSDGLKKARTRSLRAKTGRSRGGQPGHQAHTLQQVEQPDHVQIHDVVTCPDCGMDLHELPSAGCERRQVFDVPVVRLEVTEHRAIIKVCLGCGQSVKGTFPIKVSQPVQYGPRLKAQVCYLTNYQLLPWARTCELLGDLYNHKPAEALVLEANWVVTEGVAASCQAIKQHLIAAEVVHFDESGLRVEGKLNWLHVISTAHLTYYAIHPKRGAEAMQAIGILPEFRGRAIHDHWLSYFTFTDCQHALCNAHHLRELQFIVDQYDQAWANQMSQLLLDIKDEMATTQRQDISLPPDRMAHFEQRYAELLAEGLATNPLSDSPLPKKRGRQKQSPARNLLNRLQQRQAETLAFMYDRRVPFDNNLAERDVRMVKIKQKISGSFRTQLGAESFCTIRSYISTVRKHGRNVIDAIFDALLGSPFIPAFTQGRA